MKNLLLASTALVATAGFAAADVKITGFAEIGIVDTDSTEVQYHTDIDVTFAMTGESDGGLAFGANVDLDENNAFTPEDDGGATYFLSYGSLRLDMGDTDGAFDAAMREVNVAAGSIADDETAHDGFNGNSGLDGQHDGQIARVSYSAAGFTAGLSAEIDDTGAADPVWGLGLRYTTDLGGASVGFGLGYQTLDDVADLIGLSVDAGFGGGFSAAINYTQADIDGQSDDGTHLAIGVGYSMDALSIGANYGEFDDWTLGCGDCSGFGIAAEYDLGGGLAAHLGYGDSEGDAESYSLGLSMSF